MKSQETFGGVDMFYEKKIKYLNYYENGIRIRGAGYVRLEARDRSLRMELTVTGLHPTDSFDRDVFLFAGKEENPWVQSPLSAERGNTASNGRMPPISPAQA